MDLDRDARRILDLASDARAPAAEDKARMERKLAAVLGGSALAITGTAATGTATAGAAATAPATGGASTAVSGAKAASSATLSSVTLKWWISAGVVAAAVTGYIGLSSPTPAPAAKPRAPAPLVVAPPPAPAMVEALPANVPAPAPAVPAARNHTPRKQPATTLNEELELLHRAQTAWRAREAQAALRLLDEHRSRFPRSQLRLERDGLRVLTLCELGQKAQASALAKKLLERAPRSPLRTTIEESCALK